MPRMEVVVGETPRPPLGVMRISHGSFGAGKKPQVVPPRVSYKRPCCKTCKGDACVGRCKF
jgi:hypothetical protein